MIWIIAFLVCVFIWLPEPRRRSPKKEKALRAALAKIENTNVYTSCIHAAIAKGTDAAFRTLVSELKDQLRDAPINLERAIGTEAIWLLKRLSK